MPMHSSPAPMRKVPKAQNPYHADDGLDIPMEGPLLPTSVRLGGGGKAADISVEAASSENNPRVFFEMKVVKVNRLILGFLKHFSDNLA